jgi:cathepsin D
MVAYEKNTGHQHPLSDGIKTLSKRATGSVSLIDDYNDLWYGTISVGTPAQDYTGMTLSSVKIFHLTPCLTLSYTVDFDTGSSDLFLPSIDCGSTCSGHKTYDPSTSSTSQDLGKTFALAYGDGSTVSGEQYSDVVSIAGLTVR